MQSLEDVLRQKEAELATLQKEVEALQLAARIMARAEASKPEVRAQLGRTPSQPAMARAVLEASHQEMHVKEIATAIKAKFGIVLPVKFLPSILYRNIDRLFYKADKPNTFGLAEWKRDATRSASVNGESTA